MKFFFALITLLATAMISCTNESEILVQNTTGPDLNWYSTYNTSMKAVELTNELNDNFYTDTFSLSAGSSTIHPICDQQINLSIPHNSILTNNGVYQGDVIIKSKLLSNKGSQILNIKNCKTNDGRLLENRACIFIAIYDTNNRELFIDNDNPILLNVDSHYGFNNFNPTQLYFLNTNNVLSYNWSENADPNCQIINSIGDDIYVKVCRTGWFSCSKIYSVGQSTRVAINLPPNYTNANTIAYITFDNFNTTIQMDPSVTDRQFQSIGLPVGKSGKIVILSKQGNSVFCSYQSFTVSSLTTPGSPFQEISMTPTITTIDSIKSFLNNL